MKYSSTCGNCRKVFKIVARERMKVRGNPCCNAACEKVLLDKGDKNAVNLGEV